MSPKILCHGLQSVGSSTEIKFPFGHTVTCFGQMVQTWPVETRERLRMYFMSYCKEMQSAVEEVVDHLLKEMEQISFELRKFDLPGDNLYVEYFDPSFVHSIHECDLCQTFPIRGYRWQAVHPRIATQSTTQKPLLPEMPLFMFDEMHFDLCNSCFISWRTTETLNDLQIAIKFIPVKIEQNKLAHLKHYQRNKHQNVAESNSERILKGTQDRTESHEIHLVSECIDDSGGSSIKRINDIETRATNTECEMLDAGSITGSLSSLDIGDSNDDDTNENSSKINAPSDTNGTLERDEPSFVIISNLNEDFLSLGEGSGATNLAQDYLTECQEKSISYGGVDMEIQFDEDAVISLSDSLDSRSVAIIENPCSDIQFITSVSSNWELVDDF